MASDTSFDDEAEVSQTLAILGGRRLVSRSPTTRLQTHDLLQKGLPSQVLDHLVRGVGLLQSTGTLERAVGISQRTVQRYKKEVGEKMLSREQSGRIWKFAEILGRVTRLLGSQGAAEQWLEQPAMALDRRRPIDLLSTPAGVELLEAHLTRLEYGVYT